MRLSTGGIYHLSEQIHQDLFTRDLGLEKRNLASLSDLVSCALFSRSVNSYEWLGLLPRQTSEKKSRERYISRFLSNTHIDCLSVMSKLSGEVAGLSASADKVIILMIDQSKIKDGFECLMVSLRVGERAIPIGWRVVETEGAIGFDVQKELLEKVAEFFDSNHNIMLTGDRFYGTANLVAWCKQKGWDYRLRLKGNLIFEHEGGEITCNQALKLRVKSLANAKFNGTQTNTNIAILHETGHAEAWFIAMNAQPNQYRAKDYGMRWGIEAMFSDFKSKGFSITKTSLIHPDRIERLILILTIAMFFAVSTGIWIAQSQKTQHISQKNVKDH